MRTAQFHRPRVLAFALGAATGWLLRVVIDVLTLDPFAHPPGGKGGPS